MRQFENKHFWSVSFVPGTVLDFLHTYFIYSSYNHVEGDIFIPIFQVQRGKVTSYTTGL